MNNNYCKKRQTDKQIDRQAQRAGIGRHSHKSWLSGNEIEKLRETQEETN